MSTGGVALTWRQGNPDSVVHIAMWRPDEAASLNAVCWHLPLCYRLKFISKLFHYNIICIPTLIECSPNIIHWSVADTYLWSFIVARCDVSLKIITFIKTFTHSIIMSFQNSVQNLWRQIYSVVEVGIVTKNRLLPHGIMMSRHFRQRRCEQGKPPDDHRLGYNPGTLSWLSSHCNPYGDRVPVGETYGYPIFKWVASLQFMKMG